MAKDQKLSLNSMKISGPCGRLMCCLSYEHGFYNEQQKLIPHEEIMIKHENEMWKVIEVNVVAGQIKLGTEDGRLKNLPSAQFERIDNQWRIRAASCNCS